MHQMSQNDPGASWWRPQTESSEEGVWDWHATKLPGQPLPPLIPFNLSTVNTVIKAYKETLNTKDLTKS